MHLKHFFCMLFVGCVCVCVCAGLCVSDIHGSWAQFKFPPQCRGSVGRERERGEGQTAEGERERERGDARLKSHTRTHTHTTSSSIKRTVVSFDVMLGTRPPPNSTGNFRKLLASPRPSHTQKKLILISVHKRMDIITGPRQRTADLFLHRPDRLCDYGNEWFVGCKPGAAFFIASKLNDMRGVFQSSISTSHLITQWQRRTVGLVFGRRTTTDEGMVVIENKNMIFYFRAASDWHHSLRFLVTSQKTLFVQIRKTGQNKHLHSWKKVLP